MICVSINSQQLCDELSYRPVPRRPEYAEPIKCKTPLCHLSQPDFQKPSKGFFKHIDKKAVSREFTVHPEFVSEAVKLQYIQGLASNPLKYGWA
ncbi:hypothetical protein EB796_019575 [Bugula neritina]|uniref:Uncharacterized protein n=1 Tax=Bugula neritina TaxID=10212 RepID=A0A7J7J9S5_BUGNE|nr:hypothetical protein EB796_019575 [Bugula neritina]